MRDLLGLTVGQAGSKPTDHAGLAVIKILFSWILGCFLRVSCTPKLESAIKAVHLAKALADQVRRSTLAGITVIAGDDQWLVEIGIGNEIVQGVVVEVLGTTDMPGGESLWVAYIDYNSTLLAQGLGFLWRDAFEFSHENFLWTDSGLD